MMTNNERAPMPGRDGGTVPPHTDAAFAEMLQAAKKIGDVADMLGLSTRQVQAHIDDGSLVAVNVGRGGVRRDLRVLDADLEGFLIRRRTATPPVPSLPSGRPQRPEPLPANPTFAQRRASRRAV